MEHVLLYLIWIVRDAFRGVIAAAFGSSFPVEPESVRRVVDLTIFVVTVRPSRAIPFGIVMLFGSDSPFESLEDRLIVIPPAGAGPVRTIVKRVGSPAETTSGVKASPSRRTGLVAGRSWV